MRALLPALVALAACHRAAPTPEPPRSDFGFYLLAMTWAPSFCCAEPGHEECAHLAGAFAATHFTLHGLWPNYSDEQARGKPQAWPQYCGAYAHCEKAEGSDCAPDAPVPADLAQLAPAYVTDGGALATHEWSKHGSCTGLAAADYFRAELAAIHSIPGDATPAAVGGAIGRDLPRDDLQRAFGVPPAAVVLGCDAQCRLTQVGFCLATDAHTPIACSTTVTSSAYNNGCTTRGCARVAIQAAGACDAKPQ